MDFTSTKRQALLQVISVCNFKKSKRTKLEKIAKKRVSGPILARLKHNWVLSFFSWILSLLHVRCCCKLSLYAISRKINELNLRKWQKTQFPDRFCPFEPNVPPRFLFHRFYTNCMSDIVASYHCMQFQRKLMNQT